MAGMSQQFLGEAHTALAHTHTHTRTHIHAHTHTHPHTHTHTHTHIHTHTHTGKRLDGLWHTAVVAYGAEYYFGGGIQSASPGGTAAGQPTTVVSNGNTEVRVGDAALSLPFLTDPMCRECARACRICGSVEAHRNVRTHTYTHTHIRTHTRTHTHTHSHTHARTHTHTHSPTHTHTRTHTHTHARTRTHTPPPHVPLSNVAYSRFRSGCLNSFWTESVTSTRVKRIVC
jgi:hypothetical protein